MIEHLVLLDFDDGPLPEEVFKMLRAIVTRWPITMADVGVSHANLLRNVTRGPGSVDVMLEVRLPDIAALAAYREHPEHLAFLKRGLERPCRRYLFDRTIDDNPTG